MAIYDYCTLKVNDNKECFTFKRHENSDNDNDQWTKDVILMVIASLSGTLALFTLMVALISFYLPRLRYKKRTYIPLVLAVFCLLTSGLIAYTFGFFLSDLKTKKIDDIGYSFWCNVSAAIGFIFGVIFFLLSFLDSYVSNKSMKHLRPTLNY
ncbi:hypothetical protein SNEBB_001390 [Seison nebaliae]|nr:hypothetical protein SNEBB_001390 [Seison nebaliae]